MQGPRASRVSKHRAPYIAQAPASQETAIKSGWSKLDRIETESSLKNIRLKFFFFFFKFKSVQS